MAEEFTSIISHVSLGTNDYDRARAFYTRVLAALNIKVIMEHPGATAGNGVHVGIVAASKAEVDAFFKEAIGAGATADGEPGHRHNYGESYCGCFVRDLDGNKIEATYWDFELAKSLAKP